MIKTGIFLDLDGTLLNSNWEISKENLEYLKSIMNKYNIYLITGSSLSGSLQFYKQLGLDTWFITSNGMTISKPNEDIFNSVHIPHSLVEEFIKKNNDEFLIDGPDNFYKSKNFNLSLRLGKKEVKDITDLKRVDHIYSNKLINDIDGLRVMEWSIDPTKKIYIYAPEEIDKKVALLDVKEMDKLERIIYIGDGRNDISSMKVADISIAMKNSYDFVKQEANVVTKYTNNESGVARALKEIL